MAFKDDQTSVGRDLESEYSEVWSLAKKSQFEQAFKAKDEKVLAQTDTLHIISPPQPLLPPIHPLLALKESEDQKVMSAIEIVLKKIRSKADKMGSARDWQEIKNQKHQLQELFTTAEKGINENRASMARFYEIIKENSKDKKTLEEEIKHTQQKIEDYKDVEQEFRLYVDKYSIFERFLEDVAGVEEGWRNVRDVLNRYETLQSTSCECARILASELEQSVELRRRMMALVEEKSNKLKSLSNKLILLEVHRKDSRDRRVYWEHMMQRIKYTALDKMIDAISLKEGIKDLYQSMCKRLKVVPTIPSTDVQSQVDFIHKTILFYKEVVTIATGCSSGVKSGFGGNVGLVGKENTDVKKSKPSVKKTK